MIVPSKSRQVEPNKKKKSVNSRNLLHGPMELIIGNLSYQNSKLKIFICILLNLLKNATSAIFLGLKILQFFQRQSKNKISLPWFKKVHFNPDRKKEKSLLLHKVTQISFKPNYFSFSSEIRTLHV